MTRNTGRLVAAAATVPLLLAAGCSSSPDLVADETPRSIYCATIPRSTSGLPIKPAPLGVRSVDLVTNTPERVEFTINLTGHLVRNPPDPKGMVHPRTTLDLELQQDSPDSPALENLSGMWGPGNNTGKYSIEMYPEDGQTGPIYDEGYSADGVDGSDIAWEQTGNTVRIGFDPAKLPKLPAGKNFGFSLALVPDGLERAVYYEREGCSDTIAP